MVNTVTTDTRKNFSFAIEMDGLIVDLVKSVQLPDPEFDSTERADSSGLITKSAGRFKYGECVIEKYLPADRSDTFFQRRFEFQKFTPPSKHKINFYVHQLGSDKETIVDSWYIMGGWVKKIGNPKLDTGSSDDSIETITIECDEYKRLGVSVGMNIAAMIQVSM